MHATFGPVANQDQITDEQQEEVRIFLEELKETEVVPLDDALVLVKSMAHLKAQNLALQAHVKNMEALLFSQKLPVPILG